jgi:hypothetical protein
MDLVNILLPLPSLRLKSRSSYKVEDIGKSIPISANNFERSLDEL